MFDFINDQQLKELTNAIFNNQDYSYNENGLNIQAKSSDNGFTIEMKYSEPKVDLHEKEDFENWLKSLDDELFTDVCDFMGSEEVTAISNCINSENIETVRAGIIKFKTFYKKFIEYQLEYYKRCLANLPR